MKIQVGEKIASFSVKTIRGDLLTIPDSSAGYTHLQFRRFAGCPICNFHLQSFFKNYDLIQAAKIREVIFFHSSESEMRKYQKDIAFAAVADPGKKFYAKFGVGTSIGSPLHPKAMWASIRGMLLGKMSMKIEGGPLGLPADILIDPTGRVVAVKYGAHAYDQWEVPELLGIAVAAGR